MDYHSMQEFIEEKYKCNLGDFSAHKHGLLKEKYGTSGYNVKHQFEWEATHYPRLAEFRKNPVPNYGMNQEGMDFYNTPEGYRWFDSIREAYNAAEDGKCKELPYENFWHFLLDKFDISNGVTCQINWVDLKDRCNNDWQREICDLFIKEFGEEDMDVEFSW
jgi:hypothetical protein